MSETVDRSLFDIRQRGLVPPERLARVVLMIVGTGAIGRQVAVQAATMGVNTLHLVDFDTVSPENVRVQGFPEEQIGMLKVHAVAEACHFQNSQMAVYAHPFKFSPGLLKKCVADLGPGDRLVVASCTDSIGARRQTYDACRAYMGVEVGLLIDTRMRAESMRILTINSNRRDEIDSYLATLDESLDGAPESCTQRTTIYTANIAAGLALYEAARWLSDREPEFDVIFTLPGMETAIGGMREYYVPPVWEAPANVVTEEPTLDEAVPTA